jgi:hypothetical protein
MTKEFPPDGCQPEPMDSFHSSPPAPAPRSNSPAKPTQIQHREHEITVPRRTRRPYCWLPFRLERCVSHCRQLTHARARLPTQKKKTKTNAKLTPHHHRRPLASSASSSNSSPISHPAEEAGRKAGPSTSSSPPRLWIGLGGRPPFLPSFG